MTADPENKSTPDGGWSLFAESQMATISANNANSSTSILYDPVPALVDEVDGTSPMILSSDAAIHNGLI